MVLIRCFMVLVAALLPQVQCHMSLQEPPARNVLWRMGYSNLPKHNDDDYLICSQSPGARCPPCGDSVDAPRPRPHEAGGQWATGIIPRSYTIGQRISVEVNVTRSHGGSLEFHLCPLSRPNQPVTQRCLNQYPLEVVGQSSRVVRLSAPIVAPYNSPEMITIEVMLPPDVMCDHCVLQMTNIAEEFRPQTVMFRNCADISIQGNAKTHMAGGAPLPHPPAPEIEINTRSRFPRPFPEQKQHRFFI